ncbi:MAG TPA: methyltransferase domain-containing protein [Roseiflexaceae bacterium]|nr:methyltransferase domain-containing protein [Roseiflexaceae bacterium]
MRAFGFPATLIHGDTLVLDRWLWLRGRLPETASGERLLDVGCGSGAFSIGAALRGYKVCGLSWDSRNQQVAQERAQLCGARDTIFDVLDIRYLSTRQDLVDSFDIIICFETIEHIINDNKLLQDIGACLMPGGRLLLTTPYLYYQPMSSGDKGPFSLVEDGGHVRKGYTKAMLADLCANAGLVCDQISYCSGFLSQKSTYLLRLLTNVHPLLAWVVVLPLRILPPLLDPWLTPIIRWPYYSICLEAHRPELSDTGRDAGRNRKVGVG